MKKITIKGLLNINKNTMMTRFFLLLLFIAATVAVQAQPVWRSVNSNQGSASNASVAIPNDVVIGDLLIMTIAFESGNGTTLGVPSAPAGSSWFQFIRRDQSGDVGIAAYWRVAVSGDAGLSTSISTGGKKWSIAISRVTGANNAAPIHVSGGDNKETTAITAPSISTTINNTLVFAVFGPNKGGNASGVLTERYDLPHSSTVGHMGATYVASTAGATGTRTATFTSRPDKWAAIAPCAIISISSQPSSATICSGASQLLSVTATGASSLTYQWRKDGSNISGATSSTYTATTSGSYTVVVNGSGACSAVTSNAAVVTVRSAFSTGAISTTGQTICNGGTPSGIENSTAASGGDASITYSWRSSADSYASAISGATAETYTPPAGLTTTTSYRRYAQDGTCSTTPQVSTGTWTVTVRSAFSTGAIQTTGQFLSSSQTPSTIGSASSASGGDGNFTYSWRSSPDYASAISGATSATYTPPAGVSATYRRYAKDGTCQSDPQASSGEWTVSICTTGQWIGVTSTDWFTASNWCGGILPTDATDVVIPEGTQYQPAVGSTGSGNAKSHNLTINTGASVTFTADRTLELHGSLNNNGTFTAPVGTVLVSGGNNHSIGGSSLVTFNDLHLNTTQNRTLSGPVQVNGLLTFTKGNLISTTQNLLTIGQNGTVTGASDNSLVEGPVKKIGVAAFTFPVGMQNPQNQNKYQYHPIKIEPTGSPVATDAYVAEYLRRNPGEYTIMSRPRGNSGREKDLGGVQVISQTEFWNLQRVSGSTKVHLTLYWHEYSGPQKDVYIQNHSSLTIARLHGMLSASANDMMWEVAGTSSPSVAVTKTNERNKPVQGSVTLPNFSAFTDTDPYTTSGSANLATPNIGTYAANLGAPLLELGSESNGAMNSPGGTNLTIGSFEAAAMPVTLTSFTARLNPEGKVALSWVTASESVNKGFRIERQAASNGMGGKFEKIGFVASKAPNGNSQSSLYYSHLDEKPLKGTSFYRLVQEDLDGKLTNSEVRMINISGSESVVIMYPNPSSGEFTISRTPNGKAICVEVYDAAGRLVKKLGNITATVFRVHVDQPGLYNVKLTCPETGAQSIQRIVIQ